MNQIQKPQSKIFFGWWSLLATSTVCAFVQGFITYGISVIFKPMSAELNFSRTATSAGASIGALEGSVEGPLTGWLVDKYGPKWVIFFSVLAVGVGLIAMNFIQSLWQYYVVWGVIISSGIRMGLTIPVDKVLTDWFLKKRGLAIGIKFALIGVGGIVIVPITTWMNEMMGWRMTCVFWGVVTFFSLLLIVLFVKQKRPEHYGLLPDGAKLDASQGQTAESLGAQYASSFEETEFTFKQAMKTSAFWLLTVIGIGYSVTGTAIVLHAVPFLTDQGIDATQAAFIMSLMIFFTVPARFLSGVVVDHVKKSYLGYFIALSFLLQATGILLFYWSPSLIMAYVFFILYGIGSGMPSTLSVLMRSRFFGRKIYGSISGYLGFVTAPLGLVAPIWAGWVYDTTQNYKTAFIAFAALALLCGVVACFMRPPKPPLVTQTIKVK